MLATVPSATLHGLTGRVIRVEVDVAPGLPGFTIVGLADAALREARERVRGAVRNSGFVHPPRRITVNLAPAELRKAGASLDLAIATGILLGSEQLRPGDGRWALIGELSLGGEVRPVPGVLPMVAALARRGYRRIVVPTAAWAEAALVDGVELMGVATLGEAVEHLRSRRSRRRGGTIPRVELVAEGVELAGARDTVPPSGPHAPEPEVPDLADVRGQLEARRALEVTVIASAAGEGPIDGLIRRPPFRAPHHTISYAGMVGGARLTPGEVTRADHGVLFLDELPEFGRDVLEALRQPLEEGRVAIARVGATITFPARFQLVAAMNPCPCGNAGGDAGECHCPASVVLRYADRVSGPIRDRIDLWVTMTRVPGAALVGGVDPESSAVVAERVAPVRALARSRVGPRLGARLSGRPLRTACRLDRRAELRAIQLSEVERLSGRGTERLLRVARTIADLDGADSVHADHLEEAARFRSPSLRLASAIAV